MRTKTNRKRSRYEQIEDIDENDGKTHNPFFIIFGKKMNVAFHDKTTDPSRCYGLNIITDTSILINDMIKKNIV